MTNSKQTIEEQNNRTRAEERNLTVCDFETRAGFSSSAREHCIAADFCFWPQRTLRHTNVLARLLVQKCPFEAIIIINLPKDLEKETTHRYGPNTFKLHRMPLPRPGQVLGLVGTNGIGKSTALKILAGKLKPNLGMFKVSPHTRASMLNVQGRGGRVDNKNAQVCCSKEPIEEEYGLVCMVKCISCAYHAGYGVDLPAPKMNHWARCLESRFRISEHG